MGNRPETSCELLDTADRLHEAADLLEILRVGLLLAASDEVGTVPPRFFEALSLLVETVQEMLDRSAAILPQAQNSA